MCTFFSQLKTCCHATKMAKTIKQHPRDVSVSFCHLVSTCLQMRFNIWLFLICISAIRHSNEALLCLKGVPRKNAITFLIYIEGCFFHSCWRLVLQRGKYLNKAYLNQPKWLNTMENRNVPGEANRERCPGPTKVLYGLVYSMGPVEREPTRDVQN